MSNSEQVNNAGIAGMVVTDPDAFRLGIAALQVRFNLHLLYFWKSVVDGIS